jgi:hypothetical protein
MQLYGSIDIYYCSECGQFFDELARVIDIPYTEMPAKFAIQVMEDRLKQGWCHPRWRKRKLKSVIK